MKNFIVIKNYLNKFLTFKRLLLSNLLLCVTLGCASSVIGMKLSFINIPISTIGRVITWHNIGMVVGAGYVYKFLGKLGHIKSFRICVLLLALFSILHSIYMNILFWSVLRFSFGFFEIIALASLESWFNIRTDNKNRGFVFSLYMLSAFLGVSVGQYILLIPDNFGFIMFSIMAIFCIFSIVPISMEIPPSFKKEEAKKLSFVEFFKKAPVGIFSCFISGSLNGLFYSLGTIYILELGLSNKEASIFMSFSFLGAMIFQVFIGKLSDKIDRRLVMIMNSSMIILLSLVSDIFMTKGNFFMIIFSMLLGVFIFTLYPVGVAFSNDRAEKNEMASASGILVFTLGLGTVISPLIASSLMELYGVRYFMYVVAFYATFLLVVSVSSFIKYKIRKQYRLMIAKEKIITKLI